MPQAAHRHLTSTQAVWMEECVFFCAKVNKNQITELQLNSAQGLCDLI